MSVTRTDSGTAPGVPTSSPPRWIAIGNFDGVHLGHQQLLRGVVQAALEHESIPTVLTFEPHPALVLRQVPQKMLTPLPRKLELLRAISPSLDIVVQAFDVALAHSSPRQFAEQLKNEHRAAKVIVGENFRFGKDRAGNLTVLTQLGAELGFLVSATDLLELDGEAVSSSRIRRALSEGNVDEAARLLGRPHELSGTVVRGDGRGRGFGFPTANIAAEDALLPAHGVYAVRAHFEGQTRAGVANIGVRPTVGGSETRVEAHLFDWDSDLYGKALRLELVARIRGEQRFDGVPALLSQIARDVAQARQLLDSDH
jgi:riboflavin kinase / FMN adenylyltransferase